MKERGRYSNGQIHSPKELIQDILTIKKMMNYIQQSMEKYCERMQWETFEKEKDESIENSIIRAECILDRLKMKQIRVQTIGMEGIQTLHEINQIGHTLDNMLETCKSTEIKLKEANDTITDQLIEMKRERKTQLETMEDEEEMKYLECDITLLEKERMKMNFNSPMEMFLNRDDLNCVRKWTRAREGEILFDSYRDNWKKGSSTLYERIVGRKNLLFVIEDTNGNKFGGYVDREITYTEMNKGNIVDARSFVFTLNSNGRLDGKKMYYSEYGKRVFSLCNGNDDRLFVFGEGHDICIYKEEMRKMSYCKHDSFNYRYSESLITPTIGNTFIPKKFAVIQMIKR